MLSGSGANELKGCLIPSLCFSLRPKVFLVVSLEGTTRLTWAKTCMPQNERIRKISNVKVFLKGKKI